MTTSRLATLGCALGIIAAVAYHFAVTTQATGWFAYAPLSESLVRDAHPAWWPSALVGPLVGGLLGLGVGQLQKIQRPA